MSNNVETMSNCDFFCMNVWVTIKVNLFWKLIVFLSFVIAGVRFFFQSVIFFSRVFAEWEKNTPRRSTRVHSMGGLSLLVLCARARYRTLNT